MRRRRGATRVVRGMAAEAAATARRLRRRLSDAEQRAGALESELTLARSQLSSSRALHQAMNPGALAPQVAELSSALEERSRAAESAIAEWHRLLDEVAELHRLLVAAHHPAPPPIPTPGVVMRLSPGPRKLRCPRCSGPMTEYQHAIVRADRCDECSGIFFDNGELELVIAQTIETRDEQWSLWGDLFRRR
jgi:hypothetical protein